MDHYQIQKYQRVIREIQVAEKEEGADQDQPSSLAKLIIILPRYLSMHS
jgi:hypothetical protein